MADDRVHLVHPDIPDSSFDCPSAAVEEWAKSGWTAGDRPQPVNLATIEQPSAAPVADETTSTPARRTRAGSTPPEETNG